MASTVYSRTAAVSQSGLVDLFEAQCDTEVGVVVVVVSLGVGGCWGRAASGDSQLVVPTHTPSSHPTPLPSKHIHYHVRYIDWSTKKKFKLDTISGEK